MIDDHDYCVDENLMFSPTGLFDNNDDMFKDDQLMASIDQWYDEQQPQFLDYSLVPQQQLEPNKSSEEEEKLQQEDRSAATAAHSLSFS